MPWHLLSHSCCNVAQHQLQGTRLARQRLQSVKSQLTTTRWAWSSPGPQLRSFRSCSAAPKAQTGLGDVATATAEHEGVVVKIFADKDYEQEAFEKANQSAGHGFKLQHLRVSPSRAACLNYSFAAACLRIHKHNTPMLQPIAPVSRLLARAHVWFLPDHS